MYLTPEPQLVHRTLRQQTRSSKERRLSMEAPRAVMHSVPTLRKTQQAQKHAKKTFFEARSCQGTITVRDGSSSHQRATKASRQTWRLTQEARAGSESRILLGPRVAAGRARARKGARG